MNINLIFRELFTANKQAGIVATMLQSTITNIGKTVEAMEEDSDYIRRLREAKSLADDIVQEILLNSIITIPGACECICLDAEEKTKSVDCFCGKEYSLVIDPIDGTYEYINQKPEYSICSALVHNGNIIIAIVYFPAKQIAYYINPAGEARVLEKALYKSPDEGILLDFDLMSPSPKTFYKNSRVPAEIVNKLTNLGFMVIDDTVNEISCPGAIIECIEGRALGYLSYTRNMRDILLGAILSKMANGQAYDWKGSNLYWLNGGRIPRALFTRYSLPNNIFEIFKEGVSSGA